MYKKLLSFLMILTLLLTAVSFAEAPAPGSAVIGEGTAQGFGGPIVVDLAVVDGQIIAADIIGYGETEGIGQKIVDEWPQAFVDANGIIDTYSGATFAYVTRAAVIEAARAALTEAGLNPDDYMRQAEEKQAEDLTLDCDVVIVGAGGAGMTAALTAAEAGANVVLIESQPAVGGNSVKATGGMNAGKTPWQDANTFAENAGVEKTLAAAEAYADNEAITKLAGIVREQWAAWQANPEGYFDSVELYALDTLIGGKGLTTPPWSPPWWTAPLRPLNG